MRFTGNFSATFYHVSTTSRPQETLQLQTGIGSPMVRHVYLSLFYMNSFSSSVLRFPRTFNTADRLLLLLLLPIARKFTFERDQMRVTSKIPKNYKQKQ